MLGFWALHFWEESFLGNFPNCWVKYPVHLGERFIERLDDLFTLLCGWLDAVQLKEAVELVGDDSIMAEWVHGLKGSDWIVVLILAEILSGRLHLLQQGDT